MEPLVTFIGKSLAPEARREALALLGRGDWIGKLSRQAAKEAGVRRSRRPIRKWLEREETWQWLVNPSDSNEAQLRRSLKEHLDRDLLMRMSNIDTAGLTDDIVPFAVANLIAEVDPSLAAAIADGRSSHRFREVLDRLDESPVQTATVERIPPPCRVWIERAASTDPAGARRLVSYLASSETRPNRDLQPLLDHAPVWLASLPYQGWVALAEFAGAHGEASVSSMIFEHVALMESPWPERWLTRGALASVHAGMSERATGLLNDVSSNNLAHIVRAVSRNDWATARELPDDPDDVAEEDRGVYLALKAEAQVNIGDLSGAIRLLELALREAPSSSGIALRLAHLLIARVGDSPAPTRSMDLHRAFGLALRARDQRRAWGGPSEEAVVWLCDFAALRTDFEFGLRIALEEPEGEATKREASYEPVVVKAAGLALAAKRLDLVETLAGRITAPFERALIQATKAEAARDLEGAADLFRQAYEQATTDEQRETAQRGLCSVGVWPVPGLAELRQRSPGSADEFKALAHLARDEHGEAIRTLRKHWRSSHRAAELYVRAHILANEADAAEIAQDAAARYGDPSFVLDACRVLGRLGKWLDVLRLSEEALGASVGLTGRQSQSFRHYAIDAASQAHDWGRVEVHTLRALQDEGTGDHRLVWTLIGARFNLGRKQEAWDTFLSYRPLSTETESETQLLLELYRRFSASTEDLADVVRIAEQSGDSERQWAAALMTAYTMKPTKSPDEAVVERLHEVTKAYVARFPESPYFKSVQFDSPEEALEQLRRVMPSGGPELADIARKSAEGEAPCGVLSSIARKTYSEALLRRAPGCLPIASPNPVVRAEELAACRSSLDQPIVMDLSALHVASIAPELFDEIQTQFKRLSLASCAQADVEIAADSLSDRSKSTIGLDEQGDSLSVAEISAADAEDLARRSAWMAEAIKQLDVVVWTRFEGVDSLFDDLNFERTCAWLSSLDVALSRGEPLLCDDVALAAIARTVGVQCFGSEAFLQVLFDRSVWDEAKVEGILGKLALNYCVDLSGQLERSLNLAEGVGWAPGAVSFSFTRSASWTNPSQTTTYLSMAIDGARGRKADFVGWFGAGVIGLAKATGASSAPLATARLMGAITRDPRSSPEDLPRYLAAARDALSYLKIDGDPLEWFVKELLTSLQREGAPGAASQIVMQYLTNLDPQDRHVAAQIVLGEAPST